MKAIMLQSKVRRLMPRPLFVPNSALTTMLLGAIQQTQLNMLSAVNRYPGIQYHTKLQAIAMQKNFWRLMCPRSLEL